MLIGMFDVDHSRCNSGIMEMYPEAAWSFFSSYKLHSAAMDCCIYVFFWNLCSPGCRVVGLDSKEPHSSSDNSSASGLVLH